VSDQTAFLKPRRGPRPHTCGGTVTILALLLLIVLSTLMISFAQFTGLGLRAADNFRRTADARLAAESGMAFTIYQLRRVRLPADTTEATLAANLTTALGSRLDGTTNLSGAAVTNTGSEVYVPPIPLDAGSTFCCWILPVDADLCRLRVKGSAGGVDRYLTIDLAIAPRLPSVFDYGLASGGPVLLSGASKIVGVNDPAEASVFAAISDAGEAINIGGNAVTVSGDLFVSGEDGSVAITGSPSIGGSTDPATVAEHIHFGVEPPEFPELNVAPLAAMATNVVDGSTDTASPGQTFTNIRIAAGTNPSFGSDTVINGVVYVEAPNLVSFAGHAQINGMMVTEDKGLPIEECQLSFAGTVEAAGVEALPDTDQFGPVKQHTGTFVLAPGFAATFAGNFSTVSGTIAADQLTFSGTSEGVIRGAVIGLSDRPTQVAGKVEIYVDQANAGPNPAGFVKSLALEPVADSYCEQ